MIESDLEKAKELRLLEEKFLELDPDIDINIFIQLNQDFYTGVRELKNKYVTTASLSVNTELNDEQNELLEYLQYLLLEREFTDLQSKRSLIRWYYVYSNTPNFSFEKAESDPSKYILEAIMNLDEEKRNLFYRISEYSLAEDDLIQDDEISWDIFFEWLCPAFYVRDLKRAGTLIVESDSLPIIFDRVTSTIKQCFAFQQYLAVAAMCRTALEVVLRDLYVKLGFTTKRSPEHNMAKSYFDRLKIDKKKKYINQYDPSPRDYRILICKLPEFEKYHDDLNTIYGDLSSVVHGNSNISKDDAEEFVKETFWIIHEMYAELKAHNS